MIFNESFRQRLKLAAAFCGPHAIRFETNTVYLIGVNSVRLNVPADLFSNLTLDNPVYLENDSVMPLINLLVSGGNIEFSTGSIVITLKGNKSSFIPQPIETYPPPYQLTNYAELTVDWSTSIADTAALSQAILFAFAATKGKNKNNFTDRIYISSYHKLLLTYATNNAVFNLTSLPLAGKGEEQNLIFTSKSLYKFSKLLNQEKNSIRLTSHGDCAIIELSGLDTVVYIKMIKGDTPDFKQMFSLSKDCNNTVKIEDVKALIPEKTMSLTGDSVTLSLSSMSGVSLTFSDVGSKSIYNTGIAIDESDIESQFRLKKDIFLDTLKQLSASQMRILYISWNNETPALVLKTDTMLSVHSLELS